MKLVSEIKKLYSFLKKSKRIILINHRKMDPDAFWSLVWFYYFLKKIWNYEIICLNNEKPQKYLNFLDNKVKFQNEIWNFIPDLIISFDVWWIEQLWDVYKNNQNIFLNTIFVNIDHHISNSKFWNINIIDTSASSTCEIIYNIINSFWKNNLIDENISTLLLAWIIADTNNFTNSNSTSKIFKISWELIDLKARHEEIINNFFKKRSLAQTLLWGHILSTLKNIKNGQIVWNTITNKIFNQTNTTQDDISWFIDQFITTIDTLKVWFLLYELPNQDVKASFRSKTDEIDLANFCSKWNWWWHKKASWFTISWKNINDIEKEIIKELSNFF